MREPEPCIDGQCRSPLACNGFGYCRERNRGGLPTPEVANLWREQAKLISDPAPLDDMTLRIDRRRIHADQLVAHVMKAIDRHLLPNTDRDVARALLDLFYTAGAYVITDFERARVGLPPRDGRGWTQQELKIYELRQNQIMLDQMRAPKVIIKDKP
jgi:hypothetical protein